MVDRLGCWRRKPVSGSAHFGGPATSPADSAGPAREVGGRTFAIALNCLRYSAKSKLFGRAGTGLPFRPGNAVTPEYRFGSLPISSAPPELVPRGAWT